MHVHAHALCTNQCSVSLHTGSAPEWPRSAQCIRKSLAFWQDPHCNDEMWHSPCQKGEGRLSLTSELAGGRIISFKMKMLMACCHSEGICCFFRAVLMSFHILTTVLVQLVVWPQELMKSLPFLMTSCRLGGEVSNGKHSGVGCNTYPGEPIGMALAVSRCSILMWYSSSLSWCQSFHY